MGVIVVVLPKLENAKKVKKILLEHGFQTVFACSSASSALQMVGEYSYGLVISGYRMPDMYYLVNTADMVLRQLERRIKKKTRTPKKRSEKEQNYIRNAKFLLMERNYLTEEEAHKYLQKCSMDNGTNMVETAQMILTLLFDET